MEKIVAEAEEIPKAIVRRVVKSKLSSDINLHKDALLAFSETARIFIHYLAATANDACKDSKRQTINADDVLTAIDEIEFPEFIQPLQASLLEFKQKNAGKRAAASKEKDVRKKSKVEKPSQINGEDKTNADDEDEDEDDEDKENEKVEDDENKEDEKVEDDENKEDEKVEDDENKEDDKVEDDENELDNEDEDGAEGSD